MRQSLTRLMENGLTYDEANDVIDKEADDELDRRKDEELERENERQQVGSMTNDYQGRYNPASRAADLDRIRCIAPVLVIFLLILWSVS